MEEERKKKHGDRSDAYLVRDLDSLHIIMNQFMGKRCENEALCKINVDMTNLMTYLNDKNKDCVDKRFRYTFFHAVLAAIARTLQERKKLNYFIRQMKIWERKVISFCYVAKKYKADNAEECMVIQNYKRSSDISPIQQIHDKTCKVVNELRASDKSTTDTDKYIDIFLKLPSFILNPVMGLFRLIDRIGMMPKFFADMFPWYVSVFVSNLGSINLNADYHHLINFGTNSVFVIVGKIKKKPHYFADGKSFELHDYLPISLTIDERIADGVYFAKSLRILEALLLNPEFLDKPANEIIDYDKLLADTFGENK